MSRALRGVLTLFALAAAGTSMFAGVEGVPPPGGLLAPSASVVGAGMVSREILERVHETPAPATPKPRPTWKRPLFVQAKRVPPPPPAPPPPPPSGDIDWYAIADCESGGDWSYSGPGYYDGGLQFDPGTWIAAGGGQYAAYAYLATPAQQIATAEAWVAKTGCVWCRSGWPHCGMYA